MEPKSTLADRSDLAPRARHLLEQQLAACGELLEPLLHNVLDDLEHELFRIAERSSGGQAQHEALEALQEVKRTRPRFQTRLLGLLGRRFAEIGQPAKPARARATKPGADLTLVDPHEFDETMAQDDLSTRTELHAGNVLFDLCHRYAVLIAAPPLDNDALPPGPHILVEVLGEAAAGLGLQRDHRLLFYRLCDHRLFGAAETFYARLNEQLKTAGILPDLRSYLPRRRHAGPRAAQAPATPPGAEADTEDASAPLPPAVSYTPAAGNAAAYGNAPASPAGTPNADFTAPAGPSAAALHALLGARRQTLHPEAAAAAAQSAEFASMPQLQEALAALQAMPSAQPDPRNSARLSEDVLAELRRRTADSHADLQPEHRDAVDLIGLLYDQLRTETRTEGVAQQLLARLQVPLLRVALSDNTFFTVRNHPARRLLNLVLETANLWLDRSDDQFDTALNQRLQRSVKHVVDEYQGDVGVIEREADDLEAHIHLLTRRAEIAERRQVEAVQGRDRLRDARTVAARAIRARLNSHTTTPLVRALLENAWTDALTLTLLRDGEHSDAYRKRLAAVDELLGPATARDEPKLSSELNHGLTQVGLQATEADQITRYALEQPQQPATGTSAAPPSQTELLIRLKARHKPEPEETPAATPAEPRKLPLTTREKHALETLRKLPFGSWLEFTMNQQGQKVARKLAWYNPVSGRCLLVNARGGAAPAHTLEKLARMLARGQVHLLPQQGGGMFDRAWAALVAGLKKFSRNLPVPEPAT